MKWNETLLIFDYFLFRHRTLKGESLKSYNLKNNRKINIASKLSFLNKACPQKEKNINHMGIWIHKKGQKYLDSSFVMLVNKIQIILYKIRFTYDSESNTFLVSYLHSRPHFPRNWPTELELSIICTYMKNTTGA